MDTWKEKNLPYRILGKTIHRRTPYIKRTNRNVVKRQVLDIPRIPRIMGTILQLAAPDSNPADGKECILRLERNNRTLLLLRRKLASYLYEPRTHELFDRLEYLKGHIETARTKNNEIIGFLMPHRPSVGDYLDFIRYAFSNFYDLERRIEEYMYDASDDRLVS